LHLMAAIVEYDIRNTKLVDQALQELLVRLIADPHDSAWRLVRLASFPDIYADYPGQWSKKSLPHLQRRLCQESCALFSNRWFLDLMDCRPLSSIFSLPSIDSSHVA